MTDFATTTASTAAVAASTDAPPIGVPAIGAASIGVLRARLLSWLVDHAYPLWSTAGVDPDGGFREALTHAGAPLELPRRARVPPRQVIAFGMADTFGWTGPAAALMEHGLDEMARRFRREDGLHRTLIAADGTPLDENAVLYDHAFALLACARAHAVLGGGRHHDAAAAMLATLDARFRHAPGRGLRSSEAAPLPLLANPHMHLLEACLGWEEVGGDARWSALSDEIATLALDHMIDGQSGALHEVFDADWQRAEGLPGRLIEPGHLYEWAWLLLRWGAARERDDALEAAIRLIDLAEAHGICPDRAVGYEAILDDMSVHAPVGRTWPQTERVKAGLLARALTGETRFDAVALAGGNALLRYLDTDHPGLWHDRMHADGRWGTDPVPASTFYHIVFAASELARLGGG